MTLTEYEQEDYYIYFDLDTGEYVASSYCAEEDKDILH